MKKDQSGFTIVSFLLIILVLAVVAGAGFYVYKKNKDKNISRQTTSSTQPKTEEKLTDESSQWVQVESGKKAFKIRVPDGWKLNNNPSEDVMLSSLDSKALVYTKGQKAVITNEEVPGSDAPRRLFIGALTALDQVAPSADAEKTNFTLNNGIKGEKTYYLQTKDQEGLGPVKGEKSYIYSFEKGTMYYYVSYNILPGDIDNLEIVERAIKTLEF